MAKDIYIPTDSEIKRMESDPNYIGKGVIKHEIKAKFRKMELTCVYHGDATNILNGGNHHRHAIKIKNLANKINTVVPYWPTTVDVVRTEKQLMVAFFLILKAAIHGAMDGQDYLDVTQKPEEKKRTELTFRMCQNTYKQIARIFGGGKKGFVKMKKYKDALLKSGVGS